METKGFETFKPASYNPRTMSNHDAQALEKSIARWGDISGITKNIQTGNLITGHQRMKLLEKTYGRENVKINVQNQEGDKFGTTATGFVWVVGTDIKLSYREVNWQESEEKLANIAANRVQGEWDQQLLAELTYDIQQHNPDLLSLTGQTQKEIDKLMESIGVKDVEQKPDEPEDEEGNEQSFKMTAEQSEVVTQAINFAKSRHEIPSQDQKTMNGVALFYIAQEYLNAHRAEIEAEDDFTPPELPEL